MKKAYFDPVLNADIEQKVPAWSPDGTQIVFWSGVEADDPRPDLPRNVWVMKADWSEQRLLTAGDDPNWSPDGTALIYSVIHEGSAALGLVEPTGANPRILLQVRSCRPLQSSWSVP